MTDQPLATRAGRQAAIVEILANHQVRSQAELQALLVRGGYEATQAPSRATSTSSAP